MAETFDPDAWPYAPSDEEETSDEKATRPSSASMVPRGNGKTGLPSRSITQSSQDDSYDPFFDDQPDFSEDNLETNKDQFETNDIEQFNNYHQPTYGSESVPESAKEVDPFESFESFDNSSYDNRQFNDSPSLPPQRNDVYGNTGSPYAPSPSQGNSYDDNSFEDNGRTNALDRYQDDEEDPFEATGSNRFANDSRNELDYQNNEFDYEEYDENFDNNRYDQFEEFDREPTNPGVSTGVKAFAIVAVIVVLAGGGYAISKVLGGGEKAGTATGAQNGATEEAPADVMSALNNGLEAWGKFAVSGDLAIVEPYFVKDNEQYDRLKAESETIKAKPAGGQPLVMTLPTPKARQVKEGEWLVWGVVEATRPGEKVQTLNWEFRIIRQNSKDPWQILTVHPLK